MLNFMSLKNIANVIHEISKSQVLIQSLIDKPNEFLERHEKELSWQSLALLKQLQDPVPERSTRDFIIQIFKGDQLLTDPDPISLDGIVLELIPSTSNFLLPWKGRLATGRTLPHSWVYVEGAKPQISINLMYISPEDPNDFPQVLQLRTPEVTPCGDEPSTSCNFYSAFVLFDILTDILITTPTTVTLNQASVYYPGRAITLNIAKAKPKQN